MHHILSDLSQGYCSALTLIVNAPPLVLPHTSATLNMRQKIYRKNMKKLQNEKQIE